MGADMAIEEQNGFWWGTDPADACAFLERHLGRGQWSYTHSPLRDFAGTGQWLSPPSIVTCECGSEVCRLEVDDNDRICKRECSRCGASRRFLPDQKECCVGSEYVFFTECECGCNLVSITSGVFSAEGHDAPLVLVSLHCNNCGFLECVAVREIPVGAADGSYGTAMWSTYEAADTD